MTENEKDIIYNPEIEETPDVAGCVLHSHKKAALVGRMTLPEGVFAGVVFGICADCVTLLATDPKHKEAIEEEITTRLKTLKKLKEH